MRMPNLCILLLCAVMVSNCASQEKSEKAPSEQLKEAIAEKMRERTTPSKIMAPRKHAMQNPFAKGASFESRALEIETTTTIVFQWQSKVSQASSNDFGESRRLVEVQTLARELLTKQEFDLVNVAFQERRETFERIRSKYDKYSTIERLRDLEDAKLSESRIEQVIGTEQRSEYSEADLRIALKAYAEEQESEEEYFIVKIDEIVPPAKLQTFARLFVKNNIYLAHPLFANVLKLSDSQKDRIKAQIATHREIHRSMRDAFEAKERDARGDLPASPPKGVPAYITDPEFRRSYLRPFAELTPTQFRIAAEPVGIISAGESYADFRKRLKGMNAEVFGAIAAAGEAEEKSSGLKAN